MERTGGQVRFRLPITSDAALRHFFRLAYGVSIPNVRVCPNHSTPWEAVCHAYFAKTPVCVWKGSRALAGKTFALGALSLAEALTLAAKVTVLGGSGAQSEAVLKAQTEMWRYPNAPRDQLRSAPGAMKTIFRNRASIYALTASTKAARSPHPHRLRIDEADEMDLRILDAALGQPMTAGSGPRMQTVISSTWHYDGGTMSAVLARAKAKGWPVFEWCYRETLAPHGWLAAQTRDDVRTTVPEAMWEREYELGEPSIESRAINADAVRAMFRKDLGEYEGKVHELVEIDGSVRLGSNGNADEIPRVYAHGSDWAKIRDWSILSTLRCDRRPLRFVSWERQGRVGYPFMVSRFRERIERMPTAQGDAGALHDKTGNEAIADDLEGQAVGVFFTAKVKATILSNYIAAIERGEIESPFIQYAFDEHYYCTYADLFGSGHPPDSIVSGALAYEAARRMMHSDAGGPSISLTSGAAGLWS